MGRVIFATTPIDPFTRDVRDQVADYFASTGLSPKANALVIARLILILSLTLISYLLILFGGYPPLVMLTLAVLMGIGVAGIGFNVAHEARHGALSSRPWMNRMLGWTFDLLGANGYMWNITHNTIHHTYTNIHGLDEDLEVSPLIRLSPMSTWKPYHRYQHFYGLWLYSLSTLNWAFIKDYRYFLRRDLGPYLDRKHPPREILGLIVGKLVYYSWAIVVPQLVLRLPLWEFALGFVAMNLTAGLIMGVVFQLAHVVEETSYPRANGAGRVEQPWMIHEMATTANFATGNRWLSWYLGGLNFQIEHHLFSQVCSVHYPAISRIVRQVALRHGVSYIAYPTFREAVSSHLIRLKQLGRSSGALPSA